MIGCRYYLPWLAVGITCQLNLSVFEPTVILLVSMKVIADKYGTKFVITKPHYIYNIDVQNVYCKSKFFQRRINVFKISTIWLLYNGVIYLKLPFRQYTYIVGKYIRYLETREKGDTFLSCFVASTNTICICRQCTYSVSILICPVGV